MILLLLEGMRIKHLVCFEWCIEQLDVLYEEKKRDYLECTYRFFNDVRILCNSIEIWRQAISLLQNVLCNGAAPGVVQVGLRKFMPHTWMPLSR